MLEFIVLGQIPGTDLYISFDLVAFVLGFIAMSAFLYRKQRTAKNGSQKNPDAAKPDLTAIINS